MLKSPNSFRTRGTPVNRITKTAAATLASAMLALTACSSDADVASDG